MNEISLFSGCLSFLLWPFVALWTLLTTLIRMVGRFALLLVGVVFMMGGAVLTITVVGAVVGIPLAVLGFLLVVRALF